MTCCMRHHFKSSPHWRMLCVPHSTWLHPPLLLLHIRTEQQQGFLFQHLPPDWLEQESKANLLLWATDSCATSSPSVVLATWGTGGRFEGSLEELPWRWSEDVWCLMIRLYGTFNSVLLVWLIRKCLLFTCFLWMMLFFSDYQLLSCLTNTDHLSSHVRLNTDILNNDDTQRHGSVAPLVQHISMATLVWLLVKL